MSEQLYDEQPRSTKKKWLGLLLLLISLPVAGYYGVAAWRHATTHVSTDNAYVQADMAQITPRMEGTVTEVLVQENWWVKPGQVLVRLDTRDYEVRLAEAKATLTRARESVDQLFAAVAVADERHRATRSKIQTAQAEIAVVQTEFHQAELDFHRARQLAEEQIIPV
ncbi:MAG: biotin/lipoyl-binding protein [Deltaproteobacteria bacterium]|nr:biotin/lipoyl-binding protein [Deltaproteobacteria bacterium]